MEFIADEARNLSDHNVTRRLRWGIILLLTALVLAAAFERLGLPRSSRVWLFVPFFLSGNAFFQAIFKTCGFSAIQGTRHTMHGVEKVADCETRRKALARGKRQLALSFAGSFVLTLMFVLIG